MFRIPRHALILISLAASIPAIAAAVTVGSSEPPTRAGSSASSAGENATAPQPALECRAAKAAVRSELAELRKSCDAALAAFAACRASRPEWSEVELFSCGFDMSTDLTRGEFDDAASIEDCGAVQTGARAACPVPSCESELERAEEEAARLAC